RRRRAGCAGPVRGARVFGTTGAGGGAGGRAGGAGGTGAVAGGGRRGAAGQAGGAGGASGGSNWKTRQRPSRQRPWGAPAGRWSRGWRAGVGRRPSAGRGVRANGTCRRTRTWPLAEPATGHLSRWWCGGGSRVGSNGKTRQRPCAYGAPAGRWSRGSRGGDRRGDGGGGGGDGGCRR